MIERVVFMGAKRLGFHSLQTLYKIDPEKLSAVITTDDRSDPQTSLLDFEKFSKTNSIPLFVIKERKEQLVVLDKIKPELCILVGWPWLLKPELLARVPNGFIGIHGSLLPKYRGFTPLVWAMINGEKQTGITLFYLAEQMDTGDYVSQTTIPITQHDTIANILDKTADSIRQQFEEYYPMLLNGCAPRFSQDHSQARSVPNGRP